MKLLRTAGTISAIVAVALSLFQIYSGIFGFMPIMLHYPLFMCAVLAITFLNFPVMKDKQINVLDILFWLASVLIVFYFFIEKSRILTRIPFLHEPTSLDVFVGIVFILLLLECTRRVCGNALMIIVSCFIIYAFIGPYLGRAIGHNGINLKEFIDLQFLYTNGIFGLPTGVVVTYVFYFILFSSFLELSGAGQLFIDIAYWVAGFARGGPAKSAVFASSLMGTLCGSAVANVVGTGVFTIPLMKKNGYRPAFAGAVEAAASTGGQLMPPIMGATAFVMAETLGVPYAVIVKAAVIPAILYYLSIFFIVDAEAEKEGLRGIARSELPDFKERYCEKYIYCCQFCI